MASRRLVLLGLFLIRALVPAVGGAELIRRVEIVRSPVFAAGELPWGADRLLNSLHSVTAEPVIRRDLLFRAGEPFDSFLVAETGRLLRTRPYLSDAAIEVARVGSDSVDLTVYTRDAWTLELSLQPGGGGGAYSIDFGIEEENFRGRAQTLDLGYVLTDRRSAGRIALYEPALFRDHLEAGIAYSAHAEGNYFATAVAHPIWAATVPWQWTVSATRMRDNLLFYKWDPEVDGDIKAFAYPQKYRDFHAEVAHAWGREARLFLGGGIHFEEQDTGPLFTYKGVPPALLAESSFFQIPDRKRVMPSIGLRFDYLRHRTTRFLDHFGRVEDFPVGISAGIRYGRISSDLGSSVSRDLGSAQLRGGLRSDGMAGILDAFCTYESGSGAFEGSIVLASSARFYLKPALRHTVVVRVAQEGWYQANRTGQIFVGALSGVRGLPARADDGTRSWFATAEYRYFSPLHILTADLGAVLFTDVGQVWNRGESPRLDLATWTYGAGLRFGLGRTAGDKVFRIDLARGPDGWVTTYGTRMYFSFDLGSPMRF